MKLSALRRSPYRALVVPTSLRRFTKVDVAIACRLTGLWSNDGASRLKRALTSQKLVAAQQLRETGATALGFAEAIARGNPLPFVSMTYAWPYCTFTLAVPIGTSELASRGSSKRLQPTHRLKRFRCAGPLKNDIAQK
jgi:hypothetical protein